MKSSMNLMSLGVYLALQIMIMVEKKKKNIKWLESNNTVDMEDPKFELSMLSCSAEAIKQHSIKHGKQLKLKIKTTNVRAKCRDGFKWTLYASVMQGDSTLQV